MDITVGTKLRFRESVFTGSYPNAAFSHTREIVGIVVKESYGKKTGQHTFTIQVETCDDNSYYQDDKIRRKGRNVYKDCKIISYPKEHKSLADEKHERAKAVKDSIKRNKAFDNGDYRVFEQNEY